MRKRRREAETDRHPRLSPRSLDFDFTVTPITSTFPGFWKYVLTCALSLPCSPGEERSPVFLLKAWWLLFLMLILMSIEPPSSRNSYPQHG